MLRFDRKQQNSVKQFQQKINFLKRNKKLLIYFKYQQWPQYSYKKKKKSNNFNVADYIAKGSDFLITL